MSGLFQRWVESCPLEYTSPNAPKVCDVLGTWLLSILDGQRRYAHVSALRGDAVATQILGMRRIISDEGLRRALKHLAPSVGKNCAQDERVKHQTQLDKSTAWMDAALIESTHEALSTDWILDSDATIKLLYGHQDGAEIKTQTAGVKRLIERNRSPQDWKDVGQGCHAVQAQLKLAGWSHARRVVVVRGAAKDKPAIAGEVMGKRGKCQQRLHFADTTDPVKRWDYAVLVTNADYELQAMGQLYRDRADCENGFDELKNQWGWGRLHDPGSGALATSQRGRWP